MCDLCLPSSYHVCLEAVAVALHITWAVRPCSVQSLGEGVAVNSKSLDNVPMPRITLEPVWWSYTWINKLLYKRATGARRPVLLSYVGVKINPKAEPKFWEAVRAGHRDSRGRAFGSGGQFGSCFSQAVSQTGPCLPHTGAGAPMGLHQLGSHVLLCPLHRPAV